MVTGSHQLFDAAGLGRDRELKGFFVPSEFGVRGLGLIGDVREFFEPAR
jgi:hypothetical protein